MELGSIDCHQLGRKYQLLLVKGNDGRGTAQNSPDVSTPQHPAQPSRPQNSSQLKYPKINAILPKKATPGPVPRAFLTLLMIQSPAFYKKG